MRYRKFISRTLKIVVSLGLITFLVVKISPGKLAYNLRRIEPAYLVLAVVVFFISNLLGSLQWHQLLRATGIVLPFSCTFRLYFKGLFFNNFLPANVGGDAVKIYDVSRTGNDPYKVFSVTLLDRVIGITGLCILAVVSSILLMPYGSVANLELYFTIFAVCILSIILLVSSKRLSRWIRTLFGRVRIWSMGERFDMIFDHLGDFKGKKTLLVRLMMLALSVQFLRVTTHILVGYSLGIEMTVVNLICFFVFIPLLGLIMVLPISINGLGIREGAGILLFTEIGFLEEQALLMEFITYAVMVAVSIIGGIFFIQRSFKGD